MTPYDASGTNGAAEKSKSLAVRTNSTSIREEEYRPKMVKGLEVAEQLNNETKQKYVKGRCVLNFLFPLWFLTGHRQKARRRNLRYRVPWSS